MRMRTVPIPTGALALLAAMVLLGALPVAEASSVPAADSGSGSGPADVMIDSSEFVEGNSAKSMMLVLPSAGVLTLDFKDLDFTGALDTLEFGLSNTSSSMSGMIDADSMTIDFTRATTLYLDVFARAGRHTGFGLYSLYACFQAAPKPVPLPATGVSFAAGLAGMAGLLVGARRRRQTFVMKAVA